MTDARLIRPSLLRHPRVPRTTVARCVAALLGPGVMAGPAAAAQVDWVGLSSFWDIASNWSSNPLLPGAADDVTIDAAGVRTVTVRATGGPFTVNSLALPGDDLLAISGGTLTVNGSFASQAGTTVASGTLTLNGAASSGAFTQTGGVLAGSGTLVVSGSASLAGTHTGPGSTVLQGASSVKTLHLDAGRTLRNEGTVTLTGGMNLNPAANTGAGRIHNAAGALWDVRTFNLSIAASALADLNALPGYPAFDNAGTFRKSTSGNYGVAVPFDNRGTIDVAAGTFTFTAGSVQRGAMALAAGAGVTLSAGTHEVQAGAGFSGPGTLTLAGAATVLNLAAPTTVASGFTMNGGTLQGAELLLTGSTTLANSASLGVMAGPGTTRLQGPTTIANFSLDAGRVLRNEGSTTIIGSLDLNRLAGGGAARLENAAGALIDVRTSNHAISATNHGAADTGLDATFVNAGTLRKSNLANTYGVNVSFENLAGALVDVQTGGFAFNGGGTHAGAVQLAAGTAFTFGGGTHGVAAGASFGGSGRLTLAGAATVLDLAAPLTVTSAFSHTGGTLRGADLVLAGPATLGINASLGMMTGPATTTLQGASTLGGVNAFGLDAQRVLRNEGTLLVAGSMQLNRTDAPGAGRLVNAAGGVMDVQTFNLAIVAANHGAGDDGSDARFDNAGLLKKTTGGNYTIAVPFFNTGTVSVEAGSLTFSGGFAGQAGVVQGNGSLVTPLLLNAGVVAPGLSPGTLTLSGDFAQSAGGTLQIELEGLASFDRLAVSGSATLDGTLQVRRFGGYVPTLGDSFVVLTAGGPLTGSFGALDLVGFASGAAFDVLVDSVGRTVTLQVSAVPEPGTALLWAAGLGMLGWLARRRRAG